MSLPAPDILDREFLTVRAKILEIAAALDRLDRAEGSVAGDSRIKQVRQGLSVLMEGEPARAERIQLVFSLPYDPQWRTNLRVPAAG